MAMPASGTLGLIANAGGSCTSITGAVCLNATAPKSLRNVSLTALKTAPHGMTEFYNYAGPATQYNLGFSSMSSVGTCGVSTIVCRTNCICSNPAMATGWCTCVCLTHCLVGGGNTGAQAYVCVWCNGSSIQSYSRGSGVNGSVSHSFMYCQGDTACIMNCATHPLAGAPASSSCSCLVSTCGEVGRFCPVIPSLTNIYTC